MINIVMTKDTKTTPPKESPQDNSTKTVKATLCKELGVSPVTLDALIERGDVTLPPCED